VTSKIVEEVFEDEQPQSGVRRLCTVNGIHVPSVGDYRRALGELELSDQHRAMLRAHAAKGDRGLASALIAAAIGHSTANAANSQYGKLGGKFADFLSIDLPSYPDGKKHYQTSALAHEGERDEFGRFVWVMYDELRQALAAEGLA
jgi:predicted HNH restriction endonuclease